jgi:hypothetical protein
MSAIAATIIAICTAISGTAWAVASVRRARYKHEFGVTALEDVPPERRAQIIKAVGAAWPEPSPKISIHLPGRSRKALEEPSSP